MSSQIPIIFRSILFAGQLAVSKAEGTLGITIISRYFGTTLNIFNESMNR